MSKRTSGLVLVAVGAGALYLLSKRAGGSNGGTGEVVYLHAQDAFGIVGVHTIRDKATGANMGNVQYEPNVFSLVAGKTYEYVSSGKYSAELTTSWATWPEKPVNTRSVLLSILSGSLVGDIAGVGFEFKLT